MIVRLRSFVTRWTAVVPVAAVVLLVFTWGRDLAGAVVALVTLVIAGAVLAAVHHAEVIAHRVGEPFGSLVLAVAVTVIEVALIVTLMADGGDKSSTLARDTVFAAVMITCNGIVGLSLLVASLRHGNPGLQPGGHRRRPRDGRDAGHAQPGAADVHHEQAALSSPLPNSPSPRSPC